MFPPSSLFNSIKLKFYVYSVNCLVCPTPRVSFIAHMATREFLRFIFFIFPSWRRNKVCEKKTFPYAKGSQLHLMAVVAFANRPPIAIFPSKARNP